MVNTTDNLVVTRDIRAEVRTGIVVGANVTSTTTLLVSIGGSTIETGVLSSYSPVIGDVVVVVNQRSSWVTIGTPNTVNNPVVVTAAKWTPLTLAAGIIDAPGSGGPSPAYRLRQGRVHFRGRLGRSGGLDLANGQHLFTMPAGIRPVGGFAWGWAVCRSSGGSPAPVPTTRIDIDPTTGLANLYDNVSGADQDRPEWVGLENISYFID